MSASSQYALWLQNKYGGLKAEVPFERTWEFFADDLDERIHTRRLIGASSQYDIFLSYSRSDRALADELVCSLKAAGLRVWFDDQELPDPEEHRFILYRGINDGIARSRGGVALVTNSFLEKAWTFHEMRGMTRNDMLRFLVVSGVDDEVIGTMVISEGSSQVTVLDTGQSSISVIAEYIHADFIGAPIKGQ